MNFQSMVFLTLFFFSFSLFSQEEKKMIGTIVKQEGGVDLLHPIKGKVQGSKKGEVVDKTHVQIEGQTFEKRPSHLGSKVYSGNLIRTDGSGKVKIVSPKGEQFFVGPSSFFQLGESLKNKTEGDVSKLKLLFGSFRSVITKEEVRKEIEIQTPQAVMGVRGTDFFVTQRSSLYGTKVAVLRGKVVISPKENLGLNQEVEKGETAKIQDSKEKKLEVSSTTQGELLRIQRHSLVHVSKKEEEQVKQSVVDEIQQLEKKAMENTLNDIKKDDPSLYKKIEKQKNESLDVVNAQVVGSLYASAPPSTTQDITEESIERSQSKPKLKEWDSWDENIYNKYFRPGGKSDL